MEKIVADESPKMIGFVQSYEDEVFAAWILVQPNEYLASVSAYEVWQHYKRLAK
jgi:hypothetical protein